MVTRYCLWPAQDTLVEALLAAVAAAGITGGNLAALNEFAKDMAGHAEGNVRDQGHDFPPSVHFLPGVWLWGAVRAGRYR